MFVVDELYSSHVIIQCHIHKAMQQISKGINRLCTQRGLLLTSSPALGSYSPQKMVQLRLYLGCSSWRKEREKW